MSSNTLKPFVINSTDLLFILDQLNFLPLFDALGNAIINWDGTGAVYNSKHVAYANLGSAEANIAAYGTSYQSVTDLAGLRDVSGLNNNLSLVNADWGAVDQIFTRSAAADYAGYSPIMQAVAEYAYAAAKLYYGKYSDGSATDGTPTGTFNVNGSLNTDYAVTLDTTASALPGDALAADGTAINIQSVIDYTPRMISLATTTAGVTYDTWVNHAGDPLAANHQPTEIYYDANGLASVLDWGELATVADGGQGQGDTQARLAASAGQGDHFIGGLNPGVSPSNGFFVLFGQFFDHGLDFIGKSSGATVKIALAADDPLYGMVGPDGQPVHEITITRASVETFDANGPEYTNRTSPFIDQSQTYGSHEQLTNLLREWVGDPATGQFHAGMKLLDGQTLETPWAKPDGTLTHDTLPTLDELRAHIVATGRDALTWEDVNNLRNRDAAGHVIAGTSGSALLLDMNPRFDAGHMHGFYDKNGDGTQGVGEASYGNAAQAAKVDAAIATIDAAVKALYGAASSFGIDATTHKLTLFIENLPVGTPPNTPHTLTGASALYPFVNFADFSVTASAGAVHDAVGEILMASVGDHYIAGDGRVNENFGLTSVHHVFHEEHNYQIGNLIEALHREDIVAGDASHAQLHAFQIDTGATNAAGDFIYGDGSIAWNQDKMFNAGKLVVEMEYQHAAVDQYARNVTPNIQEFVGYTSSVNSAVSLEYAQAAFRFGHSTLRETIDTIDPTGGLTGKIMGYALKEAFLSPEKYADVGPSAVLLGMSHQQQNEVDEFITPALNQGLLGQPLDLAAINIARGRDLGIPTLNDFREAIGLTRYTSWTDFGQNMQHPSSLVNFIAAYSFDGDLDKAQAILDLVDGVIAEGTPEAEGFTVAGAFAFLEGGDHGFDHIDTWLGGLAEIHQPGGLLGETFDKVFVTQIEALMDGDRFYYLFRLAGQQFAEEVGNGQLKDIVERNTGLTHLNGNIFGYADKYYDLGANKEVAAAPGAETLTTGNNHKYGDVYDTDGQFVEAGALTLHPEMGVYSNGGRSSQLDGTVVRIGGIDYIRDTRLEDFGSDTGAALLNDGVNLDGTPNSGSESSEVIVATDRNDLIYAQGGDDTVYGEGGDDIIYGGFGIDRLYGGDGSDRIYGSDNPDLMDGGSGDDFLYGESSGSDINGNDQVIGGSGNDLVSGGVGIDKLSGGTGDDRIFGDQDTDPFTHGSDGNDYVDGGSGGDILYGDNGDDILVGGGDQDQLFGGNGDDIIRPGDTTGALTIGTDEVLGGDGVTDDGGAPGTTGFDIVDFSDNAVRPGGVTFDLLNQANPGTTLNGTPTQIATFQIEGVIGSGGGDKIIGGDGANWLIGGSGTDTLTGGLGNDLIIGGSVRLDTLIGKYNSGYTHNNGNAGLTEADQLQDALYQGASHRVLHSESIDNTGLIDAINATIPGTADDMAKHFTEMLRTEMFKDTVLGDGGQDATTKASADIAVFTGTYADYRITQVPYTAGNSDGPLLAYKVQDLRDPAATDTNGTLIPTDGTDVVVGIETLRFSDRDVSLLNTPPVLDLHAFDTGNYRDEFTSASFANSNGSQAWAATPWVESGDSGGVTSGQIQIDAGGGGGTNELRFVGGTGAGFDGATIQRTVNLAGVTTATLSYSFDQNNIDPGETLTVLFAADGVNFSQTIQTITNTSGNNNGNGTTSVALTGPFTATSAIRFVASGINAQNEDVRIDNLNIAFTKPSNDGSSSHTTTFTENGNAVAIASGPGIVDDGTVIHSAKIVLTNAQAGDSVNRNDIANDGITGTTDTSVAGQITINLSGDASLAAYQAAIQAVTFSNSSNAPSAVDRVVAVTVNDGLADSNIATATIHVVPVNDAPNASGDRIVSNLGNGQAFTLPDWALLANDSDPDSVIRISAVSNANSLSVTHPANGPVSVTDTGGNAANGGSFSYTASDGTLTNNASVQLVSDTTGTVDGGNGADILVGNAAESTFDGGTGNDIVFAGAGDDTIVWNANNNGPTDGRDIVDGGVEGAAGDTFLVNGNTQSEVFRVYSKAAAVAAGIYAADGSAEIIVTRNLTAGQAPTIIAELTDIEELRILGGTGGGNTVQAIGDFSPTSLRLNTITIEGSEQNDTIDISGLQSAHRVVFRSMGGNDTLIGALRPQDVIELASGKTLADYARTDNPDGTTTLSCEGQSITYLSAGEPTIHDGAGGAILPPGEGGPDQHDDPACDCDGDDDHDAGTGTPAPTPSGGATRVGTANGDTLLGTAGADNIIGLSGDDVLIGDGGDDAISAGEGADFVDGGAGRDAIQGGAGDDTLFAGSDADLIHGDAGADRIFGEGGNDVIYAGAGDDTVVGGAGDDLFVAEVSDGNDVYFGDEIDGGNGIDSLDLSAITANLTVDLGNGLLGRGSALSSQSGTDTLWSIENVATGSGDDTITASAAVNVMEGGAGNDTFRFLSAASADGDTILDFEPGDRLDLAGIDANTATGGNQAFTLIPGQAFTASGQLMVSYETRDGADYTIVSGNVGGTLEEDFRIELKGSHNLTGTNFVL